MRTSPAIERYDRMMRADLGASPVYSWKWSEDLLHVMDEVAQGDGKPILKPVLVGSVYAVRQQKVTRRWPGIWQQWVICALIELNADDGAIHGTGIAAWIPCYDRRSRPCAIPENTQPNQSHTEAFIRQIRRMRTRDAEELGKFEDFHKPNTVPLDESERNTMMLSRAEKQKFDNMKDAIKDGFTAFGEEPGKKGSTSWPTNANEMRVDFNDYLKSIGQAGYPDAEHLANIQEIANRLSSTPPESDTPA